jgi:hypothetical protein
VNLDEKARCSWGEYRIGFGVIELPTKTSIHFKAVADPERGKVTTWESTMFLGR